MKLNKLIVAAAISIFCSNLCTAQKSLDLEDVLSGKLIRTKGVGAMNWMKDGERYSRLDPNKEEGGCRSLPRQRQCPRSNYPLCYVHR